MELFIGVSKDHNERMAEIIAREVLEGLIGTKTVPYAHRESTGYQLGRASIIEQKENTTGRGST